MDQVVVDVPLVERAHLHVAKVLRVGDIAVDATVGNGFDTCFLALQVGAAGLVYGFDIQASALDEASRQLQTHRLADRCRLVLVGHESMKDAIDAQHHGRVRAVMFNLGYLPKGDKSITTRADSTVAALDAARSLLATGGLISMVAYLGHPGGRQEYEAVSAWTRQLSKTHYGVCEEIPGRGANAPRLLLIRSTGAGDETNL